MGLRPAPQTLIAIVAESLATLVLSVAMLEARVAARDRSVAPAVARRIGHAARDVA